MILKYLLLLLPVVAVIGSIGYLAMLFMDDKNWSTDSNSPAEDIEARTAARGTLVSIVSAIVLNIIGAAMAAAGVPEGMIVTNYGFILGPVIGYLLDIGIGTDKGYSKFENFFTKWIPYIFASLMTGNFLRYIVTVLLDLFISDPIQDVMKISMVNVARELSEGGMYSRFVASNLPSMLQSIVAFVTFQAYTNQTRFNWAYPSALLPLDKRINSTTITLVTSLAGCVYLVMNKTIVEDGVITANPNVATNVAYVLFGIMTLYLINQFEMADAPTEEPTEEDKQDNLSFFAGVGIFIFFVLYGLVWPFMNSGKAGRIENSSPINYNDSYNDNYA